MARGRVVFGAFLFSLGLSAGLEARAEEDPHSSHAQPPASASDPDPMAAMEAMEPMGHWMTMLHGYAFLSANDQGGPSGGNRTFESENHLMVMATRRWRGGKFSLLGTFALEPLTIPPEGSPLLFQRGETYKDVLIVDRQHPHDLFVQLAARWEKDLSEKVRFVVYLAPSGEPTVGPTAYTHRLSSSTDPLAPLAHHNQDSTHLSADVVMLGVTLGPVSVEGSAFHGEEPDENRFDIDQGPIDSYAGRMALRPIEGLSLQVSAARRKHPESIEEGNQTRQTASAEYRRALNDGFLATSLILGRNKLPEGMIERGSTLEVLWKLRKRHCLFARVESVDRDLYELVNKRQRPETVVPQRTTVQAATVGYLRDLAIFREAPASLGAAATVYRYDPVLDAIYGARPASVQAFMRITLQRHMGMGVSHGRRKESSLTVGRATIFLDERL